MPVRFARSIDYREVVEATEIFAEVSRVRRNGVFVSMMHGRTLICGHMTRVHALRLHEALAEALNSDIWRDR